MDTSKTQHRIWEDVDFRALKIDNGFVTKQGQMFPWMFFRMNLIHIEDLILFAHQFCRYVEHFLQGEICCIHNGILIILEILSHECRCIHRRSHKHSPSYWMFFSWACNVGHSFLSFSHLIIYFIHKFCCITFHDEIFGICHFLEVDIIRLPWSITKCPPYLTDCTSPSRRVSPWWGRTCCTIIQEVSSGCPDRSCAVTSLFHSWEDQARS